MQDVELALTQSREVVMYASDGDVTFTSSIPLAYMSHTGGTSHNGY